MIFRNMILRMILEGYIEYSISSILNVRDVKSNSYFSLSIVDGLEYLQRQNIIRFCNSHSRSRIGLSFVCMDSALEKIFILKLRNNCEFYWLDLSRTEDRQQACFAFQRHLHASPSLHRGDSHHFQRLLLLPSASHSLSQCDGHHIHGMGAAV